MGEVPYVGCKISLISKSEIRYEGTLNSINSTDATVTLENVRSFGSEGRRGGSKEVQPSPQVYELIVFRGTDIKDLKVCEMPKQEPAPSYAQQYPTQPEQPPYNSMEKYHGFGTTANQQPFFTPFYYESSPAQQPAPSYDGYSFSGPEWSFYHQLPPTTTNYAPGAPHFYPSSQTQPFFHGQESPLHTSHDQLSSASLASFETAGSNEDAVERKLSGSHVTESRKPVAESRKPFVESRAYEPQVERKPLRRDAPPNLIRNEKGHVQQKPSTVQFSAPPAAQKSNSQLASSIKDFHRHQAQTEEFDFEKSNSRLQKSSEDVSTKQFYTKKGFFDNISCEAKDRTESSSADWRTKFQQEKATNLETFGEATSRKRYPYRRSKFSRSQPATNDPADSTGFVFHRNQ